MKFHKTIASLLVGIMLLQVPATVYAQFVDPANLTVNTITSVNTGATAAAASTSTTSQLKTFFKEDVLEKIALRLSRKVLEKMTDSVITWSAGGFKKEGPSFIPNWKEYATDIAWSTAGEYVDEISNAAIADVNNNLNAEQKKQFKVCQVTDTVYLKMLTVYKDLFFADVQRSTSGTTTVTGTTTSTQTGLNPDGTLATNRVTGVTTTQTAPPVIATSPDRINQILNAAGFGPYNPTASSLEDDPNLRAYLEDTYIFSDDAQNIRISNSVNGGASETLTPAQQRATVKAREKCALNLMINVKGFTFAKGLTEYASNLTRNAVSGRLKNVSFGVPNLNGVPKQAANQWNKWQTDAKAGGWALWESAAELGNTPMGAKLVLQSELNEQTNAKLLEIEAQRSRNGGFIDKGTCLLEKVLKSGEKICAKYDATTPGGIIGQAVSQQVIGKFEELRSVDKWTDLLIVTGIKMATGVLQKGVIPLAENAVRNGLACGQADCTKKSFGLDATNVASTTEQLYAPTGSFDEVVDIPAVLYGDPIVERNSAGEIVYEDSGLLDVDGKPIPDYSRPKIVYETDRGGNPIYETANGVLVLDNDGKKIRKPKRENGAIDSTKRLLTALDEQNVMIRGFGIRKLADLDSALPGPDIGWQNRFTKFTTGDGGTETANAGQTALGREIITYTKSVFDLGVNGGVDDDPADVALISPLGVPFTQPAFSFIDFDAEKLAKYPLPTSLTLTKIGGLTPEQYTVVSMNTFAGSWKNPETGKYESVGNIPNSTEMQDMVNYVANMYKTTTEEYKRAIAEYRPVLSRLQLIEKSYQKLPRITIDRATGTENLQSKIDRITAEKKIAYNLSQMREKIPTGDMIAAAETVKQTIADDMKKMDEMILDSKKYRNEPKYTERYINLFLKDEMGILYCAFQDHSLVNRADAETRKKMFELAGKKPPSRTSGGETAVAISTLGVGWVVDLFSRDTRAINTFLGLAPAREDEKVVLKRYKETYGQMVPYRCFETSQICSEDFPCKKTSELLSCPTIGHSVQDQEYHMDNLAIPCKPIYKATLSDYNEYVDPVQ